MDASEKDEMAADSDQNYLKVRGRFIFGGPKDFFEPLTTLQIQECALRAPLDAFRQNLGSAIAVGSVPFQFAHSNVLKIRFNQILIAERIRALKAVEPGQNLDQAAEETALETAQVRFNCELTEKSIIDRHAKETLRQLHSQLALPEFLDSADELLRQVLVMSWGAFETLSNDLIRLLFNLEPSLALEALKSQPYKDVLSTKNLLEGLQSAHFNFSNSMGDLLSKLVALDSLEKIRSAAHALFNSSQLDTCFKDDRLWRLAQQRHLIVHRRSIVDGRHRERTGETIEVGSKLNFDSSYVEESMFLLRDLGCLLYEVACLRVS